MEAKQRAVQALRRRGRTGGCRGDGRGRAVVRRGCRRSRAFAPAACRQGLVDGAAARVRVCVRAAGETDRLRRAGLVARAFQVRSFPHDPDRIGWDRIGVPWAHAGPAIRHRRTVRSRLALKNGRRGGVANTPTLCDTPKPWLKRRSGTGCQVPGIDRRVLIPIADRRAASANKALLPLVVPLPWQEHPGLV